MKKCVAFCCLALTSFGWANNLPEPALDTLVDFTELDEEDFSLMNKKLTIHSEKNNVNRKYAKHIIQGICEFIALEPKDWKGVDFNLIEIRNFSNNQGYRLNISPKQCRYMINKDMSDYEIERHFFKFLERF